MSAPSMARDRLHVIGSSCRFAGVMPAPKPHSDRPDLDRLDHSCHGCRLTTDAARLLVGAAEVSVSLRHVRASVMHAIAQLMSRPCQQSIISALACVGRCPPSLCAVGHRVPPRVRSPGRMSCPEPGSFDRIRSSIGDGLLRIWAAALGRLSGSVAEKLGDSKMAMRFACRGWLHSADLPPIWSVRVASLNAAAWP